MDEGILSQLATEQDLERLEFNGFKNENLNRLDEILTILKRLDQERIFTTEWSDVSRAKLKNIARKSPDKRSLKIS